MQCNNYRSNGTSPFGPKTGALQTAPNSNTYTLDIFETKNPLKILNVYFWGKNVYFWGDNVYFWG